LFGYSVEEIIGLPISVLAVANQDQSLQPTNVLLTARKDGLWAGEVLRRSADGTLVPIHLTLAPIRAANGDVTGYVGDYLDRRDVKQAQRYLDGLGAVIEDLAAQLDIDVVGRKAVEASVTLLGADVGGVALIDRYRGDLRDRWLTGVSS